MEVSEPSLPLSEQASNHPYWQQCCYCLITAPAVILKRKPVQAHFVRDPSYYFVLSLPCEPLSDQNCLQWFWTPNGAQGGAAHLTALHRPSEFGSETELQVPRERVMLDREPSFEVGLCWGYFGCQF